MLDDLDFSPMQELENWVRGASDDAIDARDQRPPMVDFRPLRGPWVALPYASLVDVTHDPTASPQLVATFSDHIVRIAGQGLESVYLALASQTAATVVARSARHRPEAYTGPGEVLEDGFVIVESIIVERRAKRGDKHTEPGRQRGMWEGRDR